MVQAEGRAWVQMLEAHEACRCPGSTCVGRSGKGCTVLWNSHLSLSRMSGSRNRNFSLTQVFIASTSIPNTKHDTQKMLNKFVLNEGPVEQRRWRELNHKMLETSLVVQWLRIHLPVQGTWVGSLVGELRSPVSQSN